MFKKFLSFLIIFSLLWSDVAPAMMRSKSSEDLPQERGVISFHSAPHRLSHLEKSSPEEENTYLTTEIDSDIEDFLNSFEEEETNRGEEKELSTSLPTSKKGGMNPDQGENTALDKDFLSQSAPPAFKNRGIFPSEEKGIPFERGKSFENFLETLLGTLEGKKESSLENSASPSEESSDEFSEDEVRKSGESNPISRTPFPPKDTQEVKEETTEIIFFEDASEKETSSNPFTLSKVWSYLTEGIHQALEGLQTLEEERAPLLTKVGSIQEENLPEDEIVDEDEFIFLGSQSSLTDYYAHHKMPWYKAWLNKSFWTKKNPRRLFPRMETYFTESEREEKSETEKEENKDIENPQPAEATDYNKKGVREEDSTSRSREKGKEKIDEDNNSFDFPETRLKTKPHNPISNFHFTFLPKDLTIETLPEDLSPELRRLLTFALELEQGNETQKKTLHFLEYIYDHILQGKLTKKQVWISLIEGAAVLFGVGTAITALFSHKAYKIIQTLVPFNPVYALTFLNAFTYYYAQWVISIDATSRNIKAFSHFTAPSASEFNYERGRIEKTLAWATDIFIYGSCSLVGLLLCYSLYKVVFFDQVFIDYLPMAPEGASIDSIFGFCFSSLTLLMDDMIYFGSRLSPFFQKLIFSHFLKEKRKIENSQIKKWRLQEIEKLEELEKVFLHLPNEAILNTYRSTLRPAFASNARNAACLSGSQKAVEVLKTFKTLYHYHSFRPSELPNKPPEKVWSGVMKVAEWGLPLGATWGRSVIFSYVIYQTLEALGMEDETVKMTFSIIFGGVIASLVQLNSESQAISHFLCKFKRKEKTNNEDIPTLKQKLLASVKGLYDYFAALWITTPYLVLGLFATQNWNLGTRAACLLPAAITSFLTSGAAFSESDNNLASFVKGLDLVSNSNTPSQQRNKLLDLVQKYKNVYEQLDPKFLLQLKNILGTDIDEKQDLKEEKSFLMDLNLSHLCPYLQSLLSHVFILEKSLKYKERNLWNFLLYSQEFLNQDHITFNQALIGGIGGGVIGIVSGLVNASIVFYPNDIFQFIPSDILQVINSNKEYIFNMYFTRFWVLDALFRNMKTISDLLAPSTRNFQNKQENIKGILEKWIKIFIYGGASFTSVFPIYYYLTPLLTVEKAGDDKYYGTGDLVFIKLGYTVPLVFLNSFFFYGPQIMKKTERLLDSGFFPFDSKSSSPALLVKYRFLEVFKDLKWWFSRLNDDGIRLVYSQLKSQVFLNAAETKAEQGSYQVTEALKTLWLMSHLHNQHQKEMVKPDPDTIRKAITKTIGWGLPMLASFGRSLIYWFVCYHLLQLIGIGDESAQMGLSILIGGIMGSLAQLLAEVEGTEKAVYELIGGKKLGEDNSHSKNRKRVRRLGKIQNWIVAGMQTTPYIAIGFIAAEGWPLWLRLGALIPAGIADMMKNFLMFNQSIGGAALFVDRTIGKVSYINPDQMRNELIDMMRRYRHMFKKLHPDILLRLNEILESVDSEGLNTGESPSHTPEEKEATKEEDSNNSYKVTSWEETYYTDADISDYTTSVLSHHPDLGYVKDSKYLLKRKGPLFKPIYDQEDCLSYIVAVTPAVDTAGKKHQQNFSQGYNVSSLNIDYHFDKTTRPPDVKEEVLKIIQDGKEADQSDEEILSEIQKKEGNLEMLKEGIPSLYERLQKEAPDFQKTKKDVFEGIMPRMLTTKTAHAKILFPYNLTHMHWLTGEVRLHKEGDNYEIKIFAHDPMGGGKMKKGNFRTLEKTIKRRIHFYHPTAKVFSCERKESTYERRQAKGDMFSCGVIAAEDLITRITSSLTNAPYAWGAETLRQTHIDAVKRNDPSSTFIQRNKPKLKFIKTHKKTKN